MMLDDGPADAPVLVLLAHGAGAGIDTPFLQAIARGLAAGGNRVVRFEFPYMQRAREEEKRRPPDPQKKLEAAFHDVVNKHRSDSRSLVIGGKSLGGRIASMIADEAKADALVCLGYPFHPPDKPEKLRTEHLKTLRTPTLILQGERDPFGTRTEVAEYALADSTKVAWLPDGDHSFKPRKKSGHTLEQNLQNAIERINIFVTSIGASDHS